MTFVAQPVGTSVGGNLGTVTVEVEDTYGNVLVGQVVTIALAGSRAVLNGVKSAMTDAAGDATFSSLSLNGERHVHADRDRCRQGGDVEPVHDHTRLKCMRRSPTIHQPEYRKRRTPFACRFQAGVEVEEILMDGVRKRHLFNPP